MDTAKPDFHWRFEDWAIVESLYFSVVTHILTGIGVFVALLAWNRRFKHGVESPDPLKISDLTSGSGGTGTMPQHDRKSGNHAK